METEEGGSRFGQAMTERQVEGFAHIYSNGTNVTVLVRTRRDGIDLMNMLGITAYSCGVRLLVVCVMSTHFHAVAEGPAAGCHRFARSMEQKLKLFVNRNQLQKSMAGPLQVAMDPIHTETELMSKIIYVFRNPIAAGYPRMPWEYEWGSGNVYFVDHGVAGAAGRPLQYWSAREQRALFRTHLKLPACWRTSEEGLILPHSYLAWNRVEALFKNPRIFLAFLHQRRDVEAEIDRECAASIVQQVSETDLRTEVRAAYRARFGPSPYTRASLEQKLEIAWKLWAERRTFSLSTLSRVTLIDRTILDSIFGNMHR